MSCLWLHPHLPFLDAVKGLSLFLAVLCPHRWFVRSHLPSLQPNRQIISGADMRILNNFRACKAQKVCLLLLCFGVDIRMRRLVGRGERWRDALNYSQS